MRNTHIVAKGTHGVFHILGPTVEFLTSPNDPNVDFCVMKGTIPAGGGVPLHAHADPEAFFHLTGSLQVLCERDGRLEWLNVKPGDFIEVPGNAKHAFRNKSSTPAIELITTTPKIGRFFQEVGKPLSESAPKPRRLPMSCGILPTFLSATVTGTPAPRRTPRSNRPAWAVTRLYRLLRISPKASSRVAYLHSKPAC